MKKKKKRGRTLESRQRAVGLLFIAPWAVGFIAFFAYDLVQTILFSFNKLTIKDGGGYTLQYVGGSNFNYALRSSAVFVQQLLSSTGTIVIDVPLIIFFSLFIAVLLNRQFKGRALVRAIFFIPVIMACPAITEALAVNMQNMMGGVSTAAVAATNSQQTTGFNITSITMALTDFGMPKQIIEYLIAAVGKLYEIVRNSGVQIIVFLAALQAIPKSMYEVAQIEGATGYETFWKITFPMVSPLILTNVVYTIVDLYAQSDIITLEQTTAFSQMNFGLSAAMCLISSAVICSIIGICGFLISRKVFYQS
ncbi:MULTISPECIES: carbohydrate ABC transporter permease [Caproicibacterium]|uniref:Sugar ABC transporter permease n=1 Tax=Caproicibacterium argilliputei TaxID=3030016 RepID=A0AA97D9J7_9FIRM|nr:sugar ABC transporter permease [Caproicibacterium argilliputei]WOC31538.1 sugar ABC transporter permease [Caproicibacterium argilliputei]